MELDTRLLVSRANHVVLRCFANSVLWVNTDCNYSLLCHTVTIDVDRKSCMASGRPCGQSMHGLWAVKQNQYASSQPEPCKVCGQSTRTKTESPMSRMDQTRPPAMFRHVLSRQDSALRSMNENQHGCVCPTQPAVPYQRRALSPHWMGVTTAASVTWDCPVVSCPSLPGIQT